MKPRVFLPAVASGVLLWAAFFPLDLGPVAFVSLVPWLTLVRAPVSNRRRYFAAYVGGLVFFTLATNWIRVAHPMMYLSWLGLSLVMPLFWLASLTIIRRLDRLGVPLSLAVPVGWVALEYARMHFPTGFPFLKHVGAYQMIGFGWYFLGYTQHTFTQLIQIADLGGVYAVSFVVASINGLLADLLMQLCASRCQPQPVPVPTPCCRRGMILGGTVAAILLIASTGYGVYRLRHAAFTEGPLVAALQGNVPQDEKMSRGGLLQQQYSKAFTLAFRQKPDLIVWPETCYWEDWFQVAPGVRRDSVPENVQQELVRSEREFDAYWGTNILFGLTGFEWDGSQLWRYNSALLTDPKGRNFTRYDKMHLVPFGEYVPLGDVLPFMQWFTPYEKGYECRPGEHWTRFPLKTKDGRDYTFGCLICYEDSDPYLARQYVALDPVNFLVNISNDGWFNGTEEHEEHLAICRFRAVESRRSVVRAVNMGISAVIDPDGRVIALPNPNWGQSKKVEAVVTAKVPIDGRESLYAKAGDWLPGTCWLVAVVGIALGFVKRTR